MADEVYGFKKQTADKLLASIGAVPIEPLANGKSTVAITHNRFGRTNVAITAGATGTCFLYDITGSSPYWAIGTTEITAYSPFTAIADDTNVLLIPINGRWVAFEVC